ncbi:hypothetical protein [Acidianus brierleyi]|uniref:hypothetical protein n=1 Tax=Acidianus brierleyi TaxID=41673 RepID=UPI001FECBD03|nr:hypothetical protein [Acidianus brierleyi]
MILLALFFPYVFFVLRGKIFSFLPLYLIISPYYHNITFSYYINELIPTAVYYFGVLPRFVNYNVRLMSIVWGIILIADSLSGFIDLTPLLLGLSILVNKESTYNYKLFLLITIVLIISATLFKIFILQY